MKVRSVRGKRRLRMAVFSASCIFLIAAVVSFTFLLRDIKNALDAQEAGSDITRVPSMTPVPTSPPASSGEDDITPTTVPDVPAFGTRAVQKEVFKLATGTCACGDAFRGGVLSSAGFASLFFEEYGEEISAEKVSIGDVAVGSGYSGICIGFLEDVPVFAYVGTLSLNETEESCVLLSYDRGRKDAHLYGRYPVSFETYYDTCDGDGDEALFLLCMEELEKKEAWYADVLYSYGTLLSDGDFDAAAAFVDDNELISANRKLIREEFDAYIRRFGREHGCTGAFSLYVNRWYDFGGYYVFAASAVSLETADFLKIYGGVEIRISEAGSIYPVGNIIEQGSICGIVPAVSVELIDNGDGTYRTERKEIEYGGFYDEDGNYAYRDKNGDVFILEEGEELIVDPEQESADNPYFADILQRQQEEEERLKQEFETKENNNLQER